MTLDHAIIRPRSASGLDAYHRRNLITGQPNMLRFRTLALFVAVTLLAACSPEPDTTTASAAAQPALTVELTAPQQQALAREVAASGSISARELIELGVELSGVRVAQVAVEIGDMVTAGQTLVQLDLRAVQADYQQAQAQLTEAQAGLTVTKLALDRGLSLRPKGLISASDADQLTANHAQAQARVALTRAALDSAGLRRDFGVLKAPKAGVISARMVEPGQMAIIGTPMLRMIGDGELEWRAEVAERDLLRVQPGMAVRVRAPDGSSVTGSVRQIAPTLDPSTRRGMVYVQLDDPGALRAGMFATGEIQTSAVDGLTVPMAALVMRDGHALVYLVEDGRAIERAVVMGNVRDQRAEIVSGLVAGEMIVGLGAGFLNDGDRVQVVEAGQRP
jgi:RND family efflux transporter MFP subunit